MTQEDNALWEKLRDSLGHPALSTKMFHLTMTVKELIQSALTKRNAEIKEEIELWKIANPMSNLEEYRNNLLDDLLSTITKEKK